MSKNTTHYDFECCRTWRQAHPDHRMCPQHRDQRIADLRKLGYEITARRIKSGVFSHLSVS